MVLTVPGCEERVLETLLADAEIRVEAWAFDWSQKDGHEGVESLRDHLSSTTIKWADQEPLAIALPSEEEGNQGSIILVWETYLTLTKPRTRMQEPSVSFYAVMIVSQSSEVGAAPKHLLEPFKALEPNVLAPMRHLAGSDRDAPYFPASKLEKVLPMQVSPPQQFRVEYISPRFRIIPAAIAKMQYNRVRSTHAVPAIIASLNVELIPLVEIEATIQELNVSIAHGSIEALTEGLLPLECRSREVVTFLYRLNQLKSANSLVSGPSSSQLPNFDVLSIHLTMKVRVSKTCRPSIRMDLTTNVDFFQALNPTYGAPSQPIQRHNRPPSLPLGGGGSQSQQSVNTSLQPVINSSTFAGVAVSFTATTEDVQVGVPFRWRVLVNNRSGKAAKLAIYPLPRMPRVPHLASGGARKHAPRVSMASGNSRDWRHTDTDADTAVAVMDENMVYAMQYSQRSPGQAELLALTAELRIGTLAPGQCHEDEIEMVATRAGTFTVDSIRVVDLMREAEEGITAPGVMVDIQTLPDVVARAANNG